MYPTADPARSVRPMTNDSNMNVGNVVYAPRNPTATAVDRSGDQLRWMANVRTKASANEPLTLMTSVAHGNAWRPTARPIKYRAIAPALPAIPTHTTRMALRLPSVIRTRVVTPPYLRR